MCARRRLGHGHCDCAPVANTLFYKRLLNSPRIGIENKASCIAHLAVAQTNVSETTTVTEWSPRVCNKALSDPSERVPPVPIPNTEVKLSAPMVLHARVCGRVGRSPINWNEKPVERQAFYVSAGAF